MARLNQLESIHPNILRCFGSFVQSDGAGAGLTFNLLLEYAECDLDEYFAGTPPPVSPGETRLLWKQLCGVADALQTLHYGPGNGNNGQSCLGWHADLKPDNILRVEDRWKLADFGLSKFVEIKDGEPSEQTMDGGTHMYSM